MNTHSKNTKGNESRSVANIVSQKRSSEKPVFQFADNRPEALAQRKLQEVINNSPRAMQIKAFKDMATDSPHPKHAIQFQTELDNYSVQKQSNPTDNSEVVLQRLVNIDEVVANAGARVNFYSLGLYPAAVKSAYFNLLRRISRNHQFRKDASVVVWGNEGAGVTTFKTQMLQQASYVREGCMALSIADDDGILDNRVVNFVLASLNREEEIINDISGFFQGEGKFHLVHGQAWNAQFSQKSYKKAMEIAEFTLPLYRNPDYMSERAFIMNKKGMDKKKFNQYGYKLHVSIAPESMILARDILMPFLQGRGYKHKIVADANDLTGGQAGKVVTIYPVLAEEATTEEGFGPLIGAIEALIAGRGLVPGPVIAGETLVGNMGLIYIEENARYW